VAETAGAVQIKAVLRGGAAERAGFASGDEWLGVEVAGDGWRLAKLDDLPFYAGQHKSVTALVSRDRRLLRLPLTLPADVTTWRLAVRDATQLRTWLAAPH
jgi:predicted metalloprotease with PDZ domain